jgi:hypothetical protein
MLFLGIHSYSIRWRRWLYFASALHILLAIGGVGAIVWLMSKPSTPASRVFLQYSLERWISILIMAVCVLVVLFTLWAIKFRQGWVEITLNYFTQTKHANALLALLSALLVISGYLQVWLPGNDSFQSYYHQAYPLIFWISISIALWWVFLAALMRRDIVRYCNKLIPADQETLNHSIKTSDKRLVALSVGISIVYIFIQLRAYLAVHEANLIGDSWSYLYGASLGLNDPAFFSERRPWAILLIFKLLGSSGVAIEIFQLSLSAIAWLFLAWTLIRSIGKWWAVIIAFTLILGFSLSPTVQVWNHAVLSESISISLMILILALFICLSQQWKWGFFFLTCLLFAIWMSIREANTYIGLLVAFLLLFIGFLRQSHKVYWLLSFFIIAAFMINYQLSAMYGLPRWALPLAEVITKRILPDQEYLEFFSENGMPVTPELMALSGRWANSDNYAVINSVKLRKFSKWLFMDGQGVYVKFLLTHPFYTIETPLENIRILLSSDYFAVIPIQHYTPALPKQVNEFLYPMKLFWSYLWVSLLAAGFIFAANLQTKRKPVGVIFIFLLLSIPHLYLVWHGDALDVARHAVIANVQYHLGIWVLVAFLLDMVQLHFK